MKANKPTKADDLARDLLTQIVAGDLPVGTVLPREAELAEHYTVNRSVVREAIRGLEAHRLLEPVRRRGTVVLDPLSSPSPAVVRTLLVPDGKRVDYDVFENFLEVRAQLDAFMNGLAAERRTKADLDAMDAAVAAMEAAFGEPREYSKQVTALALAIARATKNIVFQMLVRWHDYIVEELEDLFLLVRYPTEPHLAGARTVVEAIRSRDADTAREISRMFHEWANRRLLEAVGPRRKESPR